MLNNDFLTWSDFLKFSVKHNSLDGKGSGLLLGFAAAGVSQCGYSYKKKGKFFHAVIV